MYIRIFANRSRGLIIRTQKGPRLIHSYMSCTVNLDLLEPYSRAQQTFTINLPRPDIASKTSREDASDASKEKSPFYSFYRRLFQLKKMKWKEGETPLREMTAASKKRHRTKKGSWGDRDPLKLGSFLFFFVWFPSFFFTFVHFLIRSSIKCIFHFPSMTWCWWGRRSLRVKIENGKCGPGRKTALKSTLKQCSLSLEFNLRN